MEPPDYLDAIACAFWQRHWPRLHAAKLVVEADADSFSILCRTFSELQVVDTNEPKVGVIKFVALSKQFQAMAKQFHLLPAERQRRKVSFDQPKDGDGVEF